MRVVWLDRAETDLVSITEHIAENDLEAAWSVVSAIQDATRMLAEHPQIGRMGRVRGTRELVVGGLPYSLPYLIVGIEIRILAVFHASRKWPQTF